MVDAAYAESRFRAPEIPHGYGERVHLLDDPLAWTLLARAGSPETGQPDVGRLIRMLYEQLARTVIAAELPRARVDVPTRMVSSHPEAVYRGLALARTTKAVTVGIARAGTMPSQVVFELMNEVLDPALVRQDHLFMSRQTNEHGEVIGATWHDAKIGRDVAEEGRDRPRLIEPGERMILGGAQANALAIGFRLLLGANLAGEAAGQRGAGGARFIGQVARAPVVTGDQSPEQPVLDDRDRGGRLHAHVAQILEVNG